jgi:selenophosphate synthetase-related protein
MIAGVYNINCQQGSTFDMLVTLRYPDPDSIYTDPTYINWDLTGYRARMQIRKYVESATPMITLTTENERILLGGEAGTIQLMIRSEDTSAIQFSGVYDLEIISPSNEVDRVLQGNFNLSYEVTR